MEKNETIVLINSVLKAGNSKVGNYKPFKPSKAPMD